MGAVVLYRSQRHYYYIIQDVPSDCFGPFGSPGCCCQCTVWQLLSLLWVQSKLVTVDVNTGVVAPTMDTWVATNTTAALHLSKQVMVISSISSVVSTSMVKFIYS